MILSGKLASPEEVQRFRTEAEAAATLDHRNIVPIYEVGERHGEQFFSMGYVAGTSLADRVAEGPLPPREAAELVKILAEAVAYAHQRGIIHRDLKPANILMDEAGQPRITDFGLAKKIEAQSDLTATGQIIGTPSYMPPEQASGKTDEVGPRSDVYSLGAVLYCLSTGRPPFQAATSVETLRQVVEQEPVSPRALNGSVPKDLETVCLKCLEKEPGKRYGTADELTDDLRRCLDGKPVLARPIGRVERTWRWCRRNPSLAVSFVTTIVLLIVTAGAAIWINLERVEADQQRLQANQKRDEAIVSNNAAIAAHASERLARQLAERRLVGLYVTKGLELVDGHDPIGALPWLSNALVLEPTNEAHRIRLASVLRQCPQLVQVFYDSQGIKWAEFDPSGRYIVAAADDHAQMWDVSTGAAFGKPMPHAKIRRALFSPEGQLVLTAGRDGAARLWNASSGEQILPDLRHGYTGHEAVSAAAFSPNGLRIVTGSADGRAAVWSRHSGTALCLPLGLVDLPSERIDHAEFSPTGDHVVTTSNWINNTGEWRGAAHLCDASTGTPIRSFPHQHWVRHAVFDPGGTRVATACDDGTACVWNTRTGDVVMQPAKQNSPVHRVYFVADGRQLLTVCRDGTISLWDVATSKRIRTMNAAAGVTTTSLSRSGRYLAVASPFEARVWNIDVGRPVTPPLRCRDAVWHISFSANERYLAVPSLDGTLRVWDLKPSAETTRPMEHGDSLSFAALSSDGLDFVTAGGSVVQTWHLGGSGSRSRRSYPHARVTDAIFTDERGCVCVGINNRSWTVHVWRAETGQLITPPIKVGGVLSTARLSTDARLLVIVSLHEATIWEVATGQQVLGPLKCERGIMRGAWFSPDARKLLTYGDGIAQIWDTASGAPIGALMVFEGDCTQAAWSPTGSHVLTVITDKTARVWDTRTGTLAVPPLRHGSDVRGAAFSPDGRMVATASVDGNVHFWDVATGGQAKPPLRHGRIARDVCFSADGRMLLSYGPFTVRIWDAANGERLTAAIEVDDALHFAAFTADSRSVVTATVEGVVQVWSLAADSRPVECLNLLAEATSGYVCVDTGVVPIRGERVVSTWERLTTEFPDAIESRKTVLAQAEANAEIASNLSRLGSWMSPTDEPAIALERLITAEEFAKATTTEGVYEAFKLERINITNAKPHVGDSFEIKYQLVNRGRDLYGVSSIGIRQQWIERREGPANASWPLGEKRAAGGFRISTTRTVKKGTRYEYAGAVRTGGYPPGKYRYHIEYRTLEGKELIQREHVDFELLAREKKTSATEE
jgi:WD40 repeat protein